MSVSVYVYLCVNLYGMCGLDNVTHCGVTHYSILQDDKHFVYLGVTLVVQQTKTALGMPVFHVGVLGPRVPPLGPLGSASREKQLVAIHKPHPDSVPGSWLWFG